MLTEKNMLTTPARPTSLSRNQSFESPPCPPYNQEDILAHAPASEEDELWAELERIKDARALREKFYAEHQLMREQLNMAGRFGLDLQQSLEQAQRAEQESYAQLQSLQEENMMLQSRAHHSRELASHLTGSQDEVMNLTNEKDTLQRELDGCRRELKTFRKELDSLVGQMTEMGTEVLDAKTKVSHYSRRLNEVEQELGATQELNVNLQEQLHVAVERQKQAQSSTAQVVKNMQSELGKVISDKTTILSTLEELENRQDKCEGRVVEMMTNTQEYAQLLDEAQTTIQSLRIESEMEGRGWTHQMPASKRSVGQLSTLASEDPELHQPEFDTHEEEQENVREEVVMSLGMELGFGNIINNDDEYNMVSSPVELVVTPTPSTPAPTSYPPSTAASTKQPTPTASPLAPLSNPAAPQTKKPVVQPQPEPQQKPQPPLSVSPQPFQSPNSSQFQQRLEEHNILQTVSSTGQSRPAWNPSVSLENILPTPTQGRSRSTSRATSRSSSRSVSQASLRHSPSSTIRNNGSSSINCRTSVMPSPQMSPHSMSTTNTSSLMDAISAHSGKRTTVSATSTNINNKSSRPRSRTTATTVEKNPADKNATPGLKFLAARNGGNTDPSNVITKTKTTTPKASATTTPKASATTKPTRAGTATVTSPTPPRAAASGRTRATSASVTTTTTMTGTTKSGRHVNPVAIDGTGSATQTGRSSPASPRQRIRGSISNGSLNHQAMSSSPVTASPSSSTATHATQATTASTAPGAQSVSRSNASSPKDVSRPSLSPSPSFPSSPLPSSEPSDASKQLKAMAEESSNGTGSRRPSVTSLPLPLPVPVAAATPSSASSSNIIAATGTVVIPVTTGDIVA